MIIRTLLIRKKNIDKQIRREVLKGKRDLQKEHDKEVYKINMAHIKSRIEFEHLMETDVRIIENTLKTLHQEELLVYRDEIKLLKNEIKFAQDFWRMFSKDHTELYNISTRLENKALMAIEDEKAEFDRKLATKANVLKAIEFEKHKLDMIFVRMQRNDKKSAKLLGMLEEE
jgi:hypothetical protein